MDILFQGPFGVFKSSTTPSSLARGPGRRHGHRDTLNWLYRWSPHHAGAWSTGTVNLVPVLSLVGTSTDLLAVAWALRLELTSCPGVGLSGTAASRLREAAQGQVAQQYMHMDGLGPAANGDYALARFGHSERQE